MKPSTTQPIHTDRRSPADRIAAPITRKTVSTSASTSGGLRYMQVSLPAAPWEVGE